MSDYNINTAAATNLIEAQLREKIAKLQIERDEARHRRDQHASELARLKASLQQDLASFAEDNLQPGDDDYKELSELMVNNGLEGLKRTFTVTVRVSYDFEVEVEASDEDAARDEVDNDLFRYAQDYVDLSSPDDYDIEATEA